MAEEQYDVVVVGATPAGIAAAVNAAESGKRVLLTQEDHHLGGLTSGGLSHTDFRTFESLGGTWRDFMDGVMDHYRTTYGPNSPQAHAAADGGYYEPGVARDVFTGMLQDAGVEVWTRHRFNNASVANRQVQSITLDTGSTQRLVSGRVFIDATYEGDLMAAAGVRHHIGVESQDVYNESLAPATGNPYVQTYNFRVTLTDNPTNRVAITAPTGYARQDFQPLIDEVLSGRARRLDDLIRGNNRLLPNGKADFNDRQGSVMSFRIMNETDAWPDGDAATRQAIFDRARYQSQGVLWTLQNDPDIQAAAANRSHPNHSTIKRIVDEISPWGLPADEYIETDHWSPALYVREGRRMIGQYIYTQHDVLQEDGSNRAVSHPTAVAMGDYPVVAHGTHEIDGQTFGTIVAADRDFPTIPHEVPYGVMLPEEVDNLLVPVAVSSSHVGFQALRYEPVWTALGQAAGLASAMAIDGDLAVDQIDLAALQQALHQRGAMAFYTSDVAPNDPLFAAVQFLGNRGFFHMLFPADADVSRGDPEGFHGSLDGYPASQWGEAYRSHRINLDDDLTPLLLSEWDQRFTGLYGQDAWEQVVKLKPDGFATRGELVSAMFAVATQTLPRTNQRHGVDRDRSGRSNSGQTSPVTPGLMDTVNCNY